MTRTPEEGETQGLIRCPYDHLDCDGHPLTCLTRETEALGLYDEEGGHGG